MSIDYFKFILILINISYSSINSNDNDKQGFERILESGGIFSQNHSQDTSRVLQDSLITLSDIFLYDSLLLSNDFQSNQQVNYTPMFELNADDLNIINSPEPTNNEPIFNSIDILGNPSLNFFEDVEPYSNYETFNLDNSNINTTENLNVVNAEELRIFNLSIPIYDQFKKDLKFYPVLLNFISYDYLNIKLNEPIINLEDYEIPENIKYNELYKHFIELASKTIYFQHYLLQFNMKLECLLSSYFLDNSIDTLKWFDLIDKLLEYNESKGFQFNFEEEKFICIIKEVINKIKIRFIDNLD